MAVPPARRGSEPSIGELTTTPRSKGKTYEKRGKSGHKPAQRRRSYHDHGGRSYTQNTRTNTFPGLKDMSTLANGVFEGTETNYTEDENKIFEATSELKQFAESLGKNSEKDNNDGET